MTCAGDLVNVPEDVDQDEIDVAVERLRARIETAAAQAGLPGVARVHMEIREGRVWIVGELVSESGDPPDPPPL